jgi:hypothetical protein
MRVPGGWRLGILGTEWIDVVSSHFLFVEFWESGGLRPRSPVALNNAESSSKVFESDQIKMKQEKIKALSDKYQLPFSGPRCTQASPQPPESSPPRQPQALPTTRDDSIPAS